MRNVQDTVWNHLRVHLPSPLHKEVLARVQAQEELYVQNFPLITKRGVQRPHDLGRIIQDIDCVPVTQGSYRHVMYVLDKVLTLNHSVRGGGDHNVVGRTPK